MMTMNNHNREQAYLAAFKAEHRELHGVLRKVDEAWRACEAGEWKDADRCKLCEATTAMKDYLVHHFTQEEAGGYLEEALTLAPNLGTKADRLLEQHPLLLTGCEELVVHMRQAAGDAEVRRKLRDEFDALRKLLLEHERGENAVMQAAYHVDLESV